MKKFNAIIIAMALVFGLGQCKKQETPTTSDTNDGMVYITVNVGDNGGKHIVYPNQGLCGFDNGDILYVGNNGHYIGYLEYCNDANGRRFEGYINSTNTSTNDKLHFYFLGGKGPATLGLTNETTNFDINIADQTAELPILCYGTSSQYWSSTSGPYSATLKNKCALVKFGLLAGTTNAVTVSNMLTTATVNFATPGITPVTNTTGAITLYPESATEKWAILLPQDDAIEGFTVNIGNELYTVTGSYSITNNGYINSGIVVENFTTVNLGDLTANYVAQNGEVLTGTLANNVKISIASGATVTLDDVTINGTIDNDPDSNYNWAGITCVGDATIVLSGTNTVKGFNSEYPGIHVPEGSTLTIRGDGSLTASSNYWGAGIGGGINIACGNIVIEGGNIIATGGLFAAGIGGGRNSSCGYITIANTVTSATATKGVDAPYSIGAGNDGSCGTVTIGGTVYSDGVDANQDDGLTYIYIPQ